MEAHWIFHPEMYGVVCIEILSKDSDYFRETDAKIIPVDKLVHSIFSFHSS